MEPLEPPLDPPLIRCMVAMSVTMVAIATLPISYYYHMNLKTPKHMHVNCQYIAMLQLAIRIFQAVAPCS